MSPNNTQIQRLWLAARWTDWRQADLCINHADETDFVANPGHDAQMIQSLAL